jgi:acetylornithine deacetylase
VTELGGWIRERRGELVSLLQELIRARSENPPGDERAPAAVVRERLRGLGASVRQLEPAPGRVSLVGVLESGRPGRAVLANAHLDTVPAGAGWSVDPFGGELRNGEVHGRGAIDHKSPIAELLVAAQALQKHDRLRGRLVLVFDADEETGGDRGMRHVLSALDLEVDHAVYAVPTSFGEEAARFFAHGRDNVFHGSVGLARLHMRYATRRAYTVAPRRWWYAPEVAAAVAADLRDALEAPAWFGGRPRARLTAADAESQTWDVHVLPGERPDAVVETVRERVEAAVAGFEAAEVEVELVEAVPPAATPVDSRLVDALVEGAIAATGRRPATGQLATVTGMSPIQERLGCPIVAFGYGRLELCHAADERIAVDDLVDATVAYAEALARLG